MMEKIKHTLRNKQLQKEVFRYLLTGGSAFVAEYLLFLLLYKWIGMDYAIASTIVYALLFVITFVATKKWTFEAEGNTKKQLYMHFGLFLFNLAIGYYLIQWIVAIGIPATIAPIFKMAIIVIWNFLIFKYIIYKK